MKIVVISDTHDNIANIDKMLAYAEKEKAEKIIHCGDVCAPLVMKYLANNFSGQINLVFGNIDSDRETMRKIEKQTSNLKIFGEIGELTINNVKIGWVHYPDQAKKMAASGKYDLTFYGHTHRPWVEIIGKTKLANPGILGGLFQKPTFAVYETETDKLELKILE